MVNWENNSVYILIFTYFMDGLLHHDRFPLPFLRTQSIITNSYSSQINLLRGKILITYNFFHLKQTRSQYIFSSRSVELAHRFYHVPQNLWLVKDEQDEPGQDGCNKARTWPAPLPLEHRHDLPRALPRVNIYCLMPDPCKAGQHPACPYWAKTYK